MQETIDRYVAGEDVPYERLRKVWADTVGWVPTVTALGYMNFYAEVRAVNLTLPPTQRIHVWLGDLPVDWSKVTTRSLEFLRRLSRSTQFADWRSLFFSILRFLTTVALHSPETHFGVSGNATTWKPS